MKKTNIICLSVTLCLCAGLFAGCGGETQKESVFDLPDAPENAILAEGETKALIADEFSLSFGKTASGYGVSVVNGDTDEVMFVSEEPVKMNVREKTTTLLGTFLEKSYSASYQKISQKDYGFLCSGTVETENGSKVYVEDAYYLKGGTFAVSRRTQVKEENKKDVGFETAYSLADPSGSTKYSDFEYFIPSIIYKDTNDMVGGAIASGLNVDKMYVKETRTGLPLAMLRKKDTGYSVAIAHLNPQISVDGETGGGYNGAVNSDLQYGSIGYTVKKGISVDFCYPSAEGPITYDSGAGWSKIYHPVTVGTVQNYSLSILPSKEESFSRSLSEIWWEAYAAETPDVTDKIEIDKIYDYNIEVFDDTFKTFGTGTVTAAGVPWSIRLSTGESTEYTFQMGFVGQQTSVGHQMLRTGYATGNDELIAKGKAIVDFWTSPTIMSDALPIVWWDPRDNDSAGHSRGYPSFLRCFVDGMEGILDAYRVAKENGQDYTQWKNAVLKTADFLVNNQNDDGSYYRAYNTNGTVCTDTSDNRFQGTSKLNTPIAVRFLAKTYELTGEDKYKNAAVSAAEYSYRELYLNKEKFVGGTPDNANTVDKEASIYAMYCFNAAYALTKEGKYLQAAEYAAACAMSWVYCYDFACPSSSANASSNPFSRGGVSGFSLIATGHSGADNYSAYMYYDLFKLYVFTGKEGYLSAARFLQNNTKLSTDYDGTMGWKYRAIGPEASVVCDFSFSTVGVWLPWSGIANIEPITNMRVTFGNADIGALNMDLTALRKALDEYGVGGKAV